MSIELLSVILFGSVILLMLVGVPLVFTLGGVAVIFIYFLWGPAALYGVASRTFDHATSFVLLAIPLFIFMSNMLMKSGIADSLYETMYQWIGRFRGGLAVGTVVICAIFAAMVGVSGAATVSMGLIALPSMLKHKYDKSIALGCVSAGGALGILIPPSVMMIMLALFAELSVGQLFLGGVFAGLTLAALFIIYIIIRSQLQRDLCPPVPQEEQLPLGKRLGMTRSLILPFLLIVGVLGSIFSGAATPTEAAGVGGVGSIICAAISRRLSWKTLLEACFSSLRFSAMIMWIVFGAASFTSLYAAIGAQGLVQEVLMSIPGGRWGIVIGMELIILVLGCFLDPAGIIMITSGLFFPLVVQLGFDPLWFGVLFIMNIEMAYLTPPVGFNLFYMKAIVPPGISMGDIYRSITPFVLLQALGLALAMIFPQIILWLPSRIIA